MKILYITGEFPPMRGSVGDYTTRLSTAMAALGHEPAVLTSVRAAGASAAGVEVLPIMEHWGARSWRRIADVARGCDLVHLEYQAGAFGMGMAVQLLPDGLRLLTGGIPFFTTFHDLLVPYLFPKAGRVRDWSVRHLARSSDGIVATNDTDRQRLAEQGIAPLWEIPIGAPLPAVKPEGWDRQEWRSRWQVGDEHKLIVHFGFINRAKGVENLLKGFDGLLRAGQPVRLLMAGDPLGASDPSNEQYLAEIRDLAAELNLQEPWMQWTGDLSEEELIHAILASDLIVLPFREGANLRRSTLTLSLALGRPVLTTEPTEPVPFLADGHNISFARRDDPGDLARRMALLLRYEPSLRRLERAAGELAVHFDWGRIAEKHISAYESVLRGDTRSLSHAREES